MQREGDDGFPDPESTETAAALALPTANHDAPPLLLTIMALHSLIFTFAYRASGQDVAQEMDGK